MKKRMTGGMLIEVLLAAGMVGGLALASARVQVLNAIQSTNTQSTNTFKSEVSEVAAIFEVPGACDCNVRQLAGNYSAIFQGEATDPNNASNTINLNKLGYYQTNEDCISAANPVMENPVIQTGVSGQLSIDSIQLQNIRFAGEFQSTGQVYIADLAVSGKTLHTNKGHLETVPVSLIVDKSTKGVVGCYMKDKSLALDVATNTLTTPGSGGGGNAGGGGGGTSEPPENTEVF